MWGPAVNGAVLLEESGGAARVHISDATAALLDPGEFELSRAVINEGTRGREALGIAGLEGEDVVLSSNQR